MKRKIPIVAPLVIAILLFGCNSASPKEEGPSSSIVSSSEPAISESAMASGSASSDVPSMAPKQSETLEAEPISSAAMRSDNLLMNANITTSDVMNGDETKQIGSRATAWFDASAMKNITEPQFSEFVDANVEGKDYSWFTIDLSDGSGIVFNGCGTLVIDYGKLDDAGRISLSVGTITLEESGYTYVKK